MTVSPESSFALRAICQAISPRMPTSMSMARVRTSGSSRSRVAVKGRRTTEDISVMGGILSRQARRTCRGSKRRYMRAGDASARVQQQASDTGDLVQVVRGVILEQDDQVGIRDLGIQVLGPPDGLPAQGPFGHVRVVICEHRAAGAELAAYHPDRRLALVGHVLLIS